MENAQFAVKHLALGRTLLFMIPCPEEGSKIMRFIVNVASPARQVTCPYVPLSIHAFSTAMCGASTSVFFSFSVSLLVSCAVSSVAKLARCFLKSAELIESAGSSDIYKTALCKNKPCDLLTRRSIKVL